MIQNKVLETTIYIHDESDGFEIHQLFPGRDICLPSILAPINAIIFENVARPLKNFIYIIVNKESKECVVIDACWDIYGILDYINRRGLILVGAIIVTLYLT